MEIVIVVLLLVILAALAFGWTKLRAGGAGGTAFPGRSGGVRGRRRTRVAARHDPMAEAVERHAAATDPHEAADAELHLRAQANRVASDLHAREAAAIESEVGRPGGARSAHGYGQPLSGDGRPVHQDGQPVYEDERPVHQDGQPVYEDERPVHQDGQPAYEDERPVHQDGQPAYEDGRPVDQDEQPVYRDEHGRPVYQDDRPRY